MRLFRSRGFSNGCVASFALMAGVIGLGYLTARYLQLVLHYSPLGVGLRLLPATGMALLLGLIAGRLAVGVLVRTTAPTAHLSSLLPAGRSG